MLARLVRTLRPLTRLIRGVVIGPACEWRTMRALWLWWCVIRFLVVSLLSVCPVATCEILKVLVSLRLAGNRVLRGSLFVMT